MPPAARSAVSRTLRTATIAAVAALALLAPGTILAEDEATIRGSFLHPCGDTPLGDVVGHGDVVRDPQAKSGWGVEVSFDNPTDARQTTRVTVALQRSFFNPAGRTSSTPADVWTRVETVELAPHETKKRVFALPAPIGAEIDSSNALAHEKALAVERARARGEEPPSWAEGIEGTPRRHFDVALRAPAQKPM